MDGGGGEIQGAEKCLDTICCKASFGYLHDVLGCHRQCGHPALAIQNMQSVFQPDRFRCQYVRWWRHRRIKLLYLLQKTFARISKLRKTRTWTTRSRRRWMIGSSTRATWRCPRLWSRSTSDPCQVTISPTSALRSFIMVQIFLDIFRYSRYF